MTVELVLLLGVYAFIIMGAFLGDSGPVATFKSAGPRLAARLERNLSVGDGFRVSKDNQGVHWVQPNVGSQGQP
jgi:hypothetical protein